MTRGKVDEVDGWLASLRENQRWGHKEPLHYCGNPRDANYFGKLENNTLLLYNYIN